MATTQHTSVLVDTCVWIALEKAELPKQAFINAAGSANVVTSPVVWAEMKLGVEMAPDAITRQARQAALERVLRYPLLELNRQVALDMGVLSAYLLGLGKKRQRTQDLWLAASARTHGAALLTLNHKDFADIPQLTLLRP
ncbi:MAG: PIN domain-containing protein [Burkholderiaceae bacterium]